MKYIPRDLGDSAENSSGGGGRGLIREIVVLSGLVLSALGILYFLAAMITDWAVCRIPPETEASFFNNFGVDEFNDSVPEALLSKWQQAEAILSKLQDAPEVLPLPYQLVYTSDPKPNAFAIPGGRIALTQGLLESLDEEVSFAFVLAHELGHFAGRDHLQRLGRQVGFGTSLAILMGGSRPQLLDSVADLLVLNYSREEESAADRFALELMDHVYGTRDGANRFFEILQENNSLPGWAYMFQTHPDTLKRIREIRGE